MKKRFIAFYNALLYVLICGPMMIVFVIQFLYIFHNERNLITSKGWYYLLIFSLNSSLPIVGYTLIGQCEIENDIIYFYYFPFTFSWEKAINNIDNKWNQNIYISEISNIEIVKLTKQEKNTKVYYKHIFNKYLKVDMKYGKSKYVYVGNYSNHQIKKIINLLHRN